MGSLGFGFPETHGSGTLGSVFLNKKFHRKHHHRKYFLESRNLIISPPDFLEQSMVVYKLKAGSCWFPEIFEGVS